MPATADFATWSVGSPDEAVPSQENYTVAASTTIYAGALVGINAAGDAGPASSTFSTVVGRAERQSSGPNVTVRRGVVTGYTVSGTAITKAHVKMPVYVVDDKTISLDSSSGTRPFAGYVAQIVGSKVYVSIGAPVVSPLTQSAVDAQHAAKGADLTDADVTVSTSGGAWRVLPATTLTGDHTLTLGATGAKAGDQITVTRLDVSAHTYAVVNGGAGAGTLVTFPNSKVGFGKFQFDGTDWSLREVGSL